MTGANQGRRRGQPEELPLDVAAITSERHYRITQQEADKFERALAALAQRPAREPDVADLRRLEEAALRGQLNDLRAQLTDYEARQAANRATE